MLSSNLLSEDRTTCYICMDVESPGLFNRYTSCPQCRYKAHTCCLLTYFSVSNKSACCICSRELSLRLSFLDLFASWSQMFTFIVTFFVIVPSLYIVCSFLMLTLFLANHQSSINKDDWMFTIALCFIFDILTTNGLVIIHFKLNKIDTIEGECKRLVQISLLRITLVFICSSLSFLTMDFSKTEQVKDSIQAVLITYACSHAVFGIGSVVASVCR